MPQPLVGSLPQVADLLGEAADRAGWGVQIRRNQRPPVRAVTLGGAMAALDPGHPTVVSDTADSLCALLLAIRNGRAATADVMAAEPGCLDVKTIPCLPTADQQPSLILIHVVAVDPPLRGTDHDWRAVDFVEQDAGHGLVGIMRLVGLRRSLLGEAEPSSRCFGEIEICGHCVRRAHGRGNGLHLDG